MTTEHQMGTRGLIPAKGTIKTAATRVIQRGNIVGLDSNGRSIEGTTISGGCVVGAGRALAKVDNTAGADDAAACQVEYGIFNWLNSSGDPIDATCLGKPVFIESEATFAKTSGSGTLAEGGIMTELRADGKVSVYMSPHIGALARAVREADAGVSLQKRTLTVPFGSLTTAGTTQSFNIGATIPANARVLGTEAYAVTPFAGGSISAMKLDVGEAGDAQSLIKQADVFAAAVDGQSNTRPLGNAPNKLYAAGVQLVAKFTSTGANVNAATSGTVTIDVLFAVLA